MENWQSEYLQFTLYIFATVWLLLGHGVFTTLGYGIGDRQNPVAEFLTLITTYPYVLMATVSGGL